MTEYHIEALRRWLMYCTVYQLFEVLQNSSADAEHLPKYCIVASTTYVAQQKYKIQSAKVREMYCLLSWLIIHYNDLNKTYSFQTFFWLSFRWVEVLDAWGPLLSYGLTLIPANISNYIHYKVWDERSYSFLNFSGLIVEV